METNSLPIDRWPQLDFAAWSPTLTTLHLWTQIVGKVRLRQMPWINHSWHVSLYVSPSGLTTGSVPYKQGVFQLDFDFLTHYLRISTSTGAQAAVKLYPRSVASFYQELMEQLDRLAIDVTIQGTPNEVEVAIPFHEDEIHCAYDAPMVGRFWQALVSIHTVFTRFRAGFTGKCSPVHFFWGSFDLAVTRFSGRRAPLHPGGAPNMSTRVMQEAYSHEVSSVGFWPGSEQFPQAVFYSYCYPTPSDFGQQPVEPAEAYFSPEMGEFLLPYDVVRQSADAEQTLLAFLQTTYDAAVSTAHWNRKELDCDLTSFEAKTDD
ncbi:DUF5996 family protein [Spirosoma humi]